MVQFLKENPERDIHLWCVGKKGRDFFRRFYSKIEGEYVNIFQRLTFVQADVIGNDLVQAFLNTDTEGVFFLYNEFKSRVQQKLTMRQVLPVAPIAPKEPKWNMIFEPNRPEILSHLLPRYIKAQIFRILLESQSAELAARMAAMDAATNNASELISALTLTMNKVRQAAITKELSEIVAGAEALQN
jgi:F-type H+-transporting ATPase subunit gamma